MEWVLLYFIIGAALVAPRIPAHVKETQYEYPGQPGLVAAVMIPATLLAVTIWPVGIIIYLVSYHWSK